MSTDLTTEHAMGGAGEILFSAQDLHKVITESRTAERSKEEGRQRELDKARAEQVKQLKLRAEISPERIANFMTRMHHAAEHGETQILILRFPSDVCTDGGRAINNTLPGWEETLVGLPRQIYEIWSQKLKPRGFSLHAEVLDFPNGMPGDIGLFCRW
jgi:hypothetical protein